MIGLLFGYLVGFYGCVCFGYWLFGCLFRRCFVFVLYGCVGVLYLIVRCVLICLDVFVGLCLIDLFCCICLVWVFSDSCFWFVCCLWCLGFVVSALFVVFSDLVAVCLRLFERCWLLLLFGYVGLFTFACLWLLLVFVCGVALFGCCFCGLSWLLFVIALL